MVTIEEMQRAPAGFLFAKVTSHYTHNEFVCHNRFGAWFAVPVETDMNDPRRDIPMKDVMPPLAAMLQTRAKQAERAGVEAEPANPFLALGAPAPETPANPFLALS